MRLRNVPGAREVMIENEYVFTEPEDERHMVTGFR